MHVAPPWLSTVSPIARQAPQGLLTTIANENVTARWAGTWEHHCTQGPFIIISPLAILVETKALGTGGKSYSVCF